MDIPNSLLPSITIIHHSWQIFSTALSVWSANTGVSMCWSSWGNFAHEFVLTSPAVPHVFFVFLVEFVRWKVSGQTAVVSWGASSRICSKWHIAFICSSHLASSLHISLVSKWCIDSLEEIQIYLIRFDFYMINTLSITVCTLTRHIWTFLSIDEILLLRYVNWVD